MACEEIVDEFNDLRSDIVLLFDSCFSLWVFLSVLIALNHALEIW